MPISSATDTFESQFNQLNLATKAKQLVGEVKSLFLRRDPIKLNLVWGHKIESVLLYEPTYCSQCDDFIVGILGFKCKSCKLVCHKTCIPSIGSETRSSKCIARDEQISSGGSQHLADALEIAYSANRCPTVQVRDHCSPIQAATTSRLHQFDQATFTELTFCNHCGTLLKGLIKQGLRCRACSMTVHRDCESFVTIGCETFAARKRLRNKSSLPARVLRLIKGDKEEDQRQISAVDGAQSEQVPSAGPHDSSALGALTISDFELVRIIGVGSFGKVYMARLRQHPRRMFAIKAIKKTNPYVISDPQSVLTEAKVLEMNREYNFLAPVHCCFQTKERLFFVMEHVEGRNLLYHVTQSRKFTEARTRFHSAEIILALRFLHKKRVIHRDLKLDNVILDREGHCKLVDYGLAKLFDEGETRTSTFCGTSGYMSPEMIKEQRYAYSVDWWALGVLMFEMLTGYSPFNADDDDELYRMIVRDEIQYPPILSSISRSILKGFLTKDPSQRLGSDVMNECEDAIMEHEFFLIPIGENLKQWWQAIETKQLRPPYIPSVKELEPLDSDQDGLNKESNSFVTARLTPLGHDNFQDLATVSYEGFSYCSQSFKSLVDHR